MSVFNVPARDEVSAENQALFDRLKKSIGKIPNLYATFAYSEHALGNYLPFQNARSSMTGKSREVINLATSQVNGCAYCLAAHTAVGKMNGLSDEQMLEIRRGRASFDPKLDALAKFVKEAVEQRGHASSEAVDAFLAAGWTKENLVDTIVAIGVMTVTNYQYAVTQVPIDFPAAPTLS